MITLGLGAFFGYVFLPAESAFVHGIHAPQVSLELPDFLSTDSSRAIPVWDHKHSCQHKPKQSSTVFNKRQVAAFSMALTEFFQVMGPGNTIDKLNNSSSMRLALKEFRHQLRSLHRHKLRHCRS